MDIVLKLLRQLQCIGFLLAMIATPALAQFEGHLKLEPVGCESTGKCRLKEAIRFKDSKQLVWEAAAGLVTDGASIPGIFQPLVGKPFEQTFLRAAVIHDHYCDKYVRTWRRTHAMFYEALLAGGVDQAKAKAMYLAVLVGGPKWIKLVPGNKCGPNCVNTLKSQLGGSTIRSRVADYSVNGLAEEMQRVLNELEKNPDALSLEDLESRARALRPNDYYLTKGESVIVSDPGVIDK